MVFFRRGVVVVVFSSRSSSGGGRQQHQQHPRESARFFVFNKKSHLEMTCASASRVVVDAAADDAVTTPTIAARPPKHHHVPWTKEEDARLQRMQEKYGNKWSTVAGFLPGRTGQQCAQRWRHRVNPNIRRDKWTKEEDDKVRVDNNAANERFFFFASKDILQGDLVVSLRSRPKTLVKGVGVPERAKDIEVV